MTDIGDAVTRRSIDKRSERAAASNNQWDTES
jgi:hypothetical protein